MESFGSDIDYHPGSHNQVIDLVHPSLYIVQYDKTPVLKNGQLEIVKYGEQIEHAKPGVDQYGVSKRFQWIPALMTKNSNGNLSLALISTIYILSNIKICMIPLVIFLMPLFQV